MSTNNIGNTMTLDTPFGELIIEKYELIVNGKPGYSGVDIQLALPSGEIMSIATTEIVLHENGDPVMKSYIWGDELSEDPTCTEIHYFATEEERKELWGDE